MTQEFDNVLKFHDFIAKARVGDERAMKFLRGLLGRISMNSETTSDCIIELSECLLRYREEELRKRSESN